MCLVGNLLLLFLDGGIHELQPSGHGRHVVTHCLGIGVCCMLHIFHALGDGYITIFIIVHEGVGCVMVWITSCRT